MATHTPDSTEPTRLETGTEAVERRIFEAHEGGKLTVEPTAPIDNADDLAIVYTPGVARVVEEIAEKPEKAREYTIKKNTVAVVTDGSAILGLGDRGPLAALPVMEGKAALFSRFADVDAFPICLDAHEVEDIVAHVKAIAPAFAGINLEDISAPRCFEIEDRLRAELDIPVFHDDQHGTAVCVLAALTNALTIVEKPIEEVRIAMSGAGAAGTAILRLLLAAGARDVIVANSKGIVREGREAGDRLEWIARHTNPRGVEGGLREAVAGADVFIGVSVPNILDEAMLRSMNERAIVFALSNPVPEVDPEIAWKYAAVVATGRSDFANQINNVLAFPGVFRGLIDAHACEVTDEALLAAAQAIASVVSDEELSPRHIVPSVFDERVTPAVARAVARTGEPARIEA
ncbi:malate dehydrogenase [Dermabacter hominis 1368]|uniref:Malate dehydrogenase n=1 Tax=Dermabacter hominis 1368 TaxID=1450519 RepID=A0ABR4SK43_9MICO|nr:malate dehydrogenase [Dermabacter hominis 1368]